jgi:hypothetical protein
MPWRKSSASAAQFVLPPDRYSPNALYDRETFGSSLVLAPEGGTQFGIPLGSLEEHMKLLTTICMPALMLGAAVLVTPAFAQNDTAAPANNAAAAAPAQPAQDANSAAAPADSAQPMQAAANGQSDTSTSANAASSSSGNTQMAMNTTGNASDLSSIPDNQHKYSRAKKAAEDRSEDQTTKQLNQQEATLSGTASSGNAQ